MSADADAKVVASFFVPGRARTKGSLKPVHIKVAPGRCRVSLTESGEESTAWKRTMIQAIKKQVAPAEPYADPVQVHSFFRFARTLSLRADAKEGEVWPTHNTPWPTADDIGDEDKLRRNLLDALTQSSLIADDDLVIGGSNYKRWCLPGETPGVLVVVREAPRSSDLIALERVAGW